MPSSQALSVFISPDSFQIGIAMNGPTLKGRSLIWYLNLGCTGAAAGESKKSLSLNECTESKNSKITLYIF
jgi:hypothetical protein